MLSLLNRTPVAIGLITEEQREALLKAGVKTCKDMLRVCATAESRMQISEKTGIPEEILVELAKCADLMRISDLKWEYAKLLKQAGVDSVGELAKQNPRLLFAQMVEVNVGDKNSLCIPFEYQVQSWIKKAVRMKPAVRL